MADDDMIIAVHQVTKIVQEIPRSYLTIFPDFRELNEAEIVERRRGVERKIFGEYRTPALNTPAPVTETPITEEQSAEEQPAEAPAMEGGN